MRNATRTPAIPIEYCPEILESAIILNVNLDANNAVTPERFSVMQHLYVFTRFATTSQQTTTATVARFAYAVYGQALRYNNMAEALRDLQRIHMSYMISLYSAIIPLLLAKVRAHNTGGPNRSHRHPPPDDPDAPGQPLFPPTSPSIARPVTMMNPSQPSPSQSSTPPSGSRSRPLEPPSIAAKRPRRSIAAKDIRVTPLTNADAQVIKERFPDRRRPSPALSALQTAYDAAPFDSAFEAPNGSIGHKLPENSYLIPDDMQFAKDFNSPLGEAFPLPDNSSKYDFPTMSHDDPECTPEQHERLCQLVQLFKDIFRTEIEQGGADLPSWFVHLKPGATFNFVAFRRIAGDMAKALQDKLELYSRMRVIIPILATYAHNVVMAPQKGAYRMCINYKPLNTETEDLKFPIPHLPDMLQFLKGKRVFSVLDNRLGYHQLRVHESAQRFLAFHCQYGLFTWLLCPMGPKTMPSWYTFLMSTIVFVGLIFSILICYFDDCVIATDTYEEHIAALTTVFTRLSRHKLVLKGTKCQIARPKVKFLGYIITGRTIAHDPDRIQQVMKIPVPNTANRLQTFLGLANFFHSFIRGYSIIRQPLNAMVNTKPFRWTEERLSAFHTLQRAINDIPTLFHIDHNLSIYLDVDASMQGFFGYLFQLSTSHIADHPIVNQLTLSPDDMKYHQPLGFISHAFSGPQLKWNNTVREIFGLTYCIIGFKSLLQSSHFYCRTDHKNFLQMRTSDNPIVNHCLDKLIPYFVTFIFNSGVKHCIPDNGSRALLLDAFAAHPITDPTTTATRIAHVYLGQHAPHFVHPTIPAPTLAIEPPPASSIDKDAPDADSAEDTDAPVRNELPPPRIIEQPPFPPIPEDRLAILRHHHQRIGHQGVTRTLQSLKRAGNYWPTMRTDVVRYVQSCPICQLTWRIPRASHIHRDTFESYDPFYNITMDFMGPYPADAEGNTFYCVVQDVFSRLVEIYPMPDNSSRSAAKALLEIYSRYTLPRIIGQCIPTDQGKSFIANAYKQLLAMIGAEASYTLPYRHQTTVERVNREVLRYTKVLLLSRRDDKDVTFHTIARISMRIINSSVHSDINCAPHELVYGINSPLDLPLDRDEHFQSPRPARDIIKGIVTTQLALLKLAQLHQAANTDMYLLPNMDYNRVQFRIGQLVTVTFPPPMSQPSPKTKPSVMGPFQILSRKNETYTLLDLLSNKEHDYHFSRLRLFNFADYHKITARDIALQNSQEFDVEEILDHRGDHHFRSTLQFLVKFTGYDDTYNDWLSTNAVCRHPLMPAYLDRFPILRRTVMRFSDL